MSFLTKLHVATDTHDPEAYIDRVKNTVRDELRELDGTAQVVDTHYFNHSAIPDFILTWPKIKYQRALYLRDSYESVMAAQDVKSLDSAAPILLSLSDLKSPQERPRDQVGEKSLITDPSAVDLIAETSHSGSSPMAALVRANFARGARGVVDAPRASRLVELSDSPAAVQSANSPLPDFVRDNFLEDTAREMTRTAQLMELALGHELSDAQEAPFGPLSAAEVRHLVPWILRNARIPNSDPLWKKLGTMMTFADLDAIKKDLAGINLDPLIRANSDAWRAKRAYVGLASWDHDNPEAVANSHWAVVGSSIGRNVKEERLHLADSARTLRGRSAQSSVLWTDLAEPARDFRLSRVELRGVTRSVAINAEESSDVREDVERVSESFDERFFVSEVGIRFPSEAEGEEVEAQVLLGDSLVVSDVGVALSDLAGVALRLISRNGINAKQVQDFIGAPEQHK
ncbi:hypothetical protein AB4Z38_16940 [Arthrobacter sp. 2RAF6]|uniref:hypothetical protein n=1 Tax=Arthrobacter sp. 2RAF6 TaxID=3233002 RepID=UPI003F9183D6